MCALPYTIPSNKLIPSESLGSIRFVSFLIKLSTRWHSHRFWSICIQIAIAIYWQNNAIETVFIIFRAVIHHANTDRHDSSTSAVLRFVLGPYVCVHCAAHAADLSFGSDNILVFNSICIALPIFIAIVTPYALPSTRHVHCTRCSLSLSQFYRQSLTLVCNAKRVPCAVHFCVPNNETNEFSRLCFFFARCYMADKMCLTISNHILFFFSVFTWYLKPCQTWLKYLLISMDCTQCAIDGYASLLHVQPKQMEMYSRPNILHIVVIVSI